ncbi:MULTISPECIES: ABC transporter permease [unclassified Actinomyces]|uniref:FtsX-like permease family protein n=1 Tax=unclassified Actinomyces TaxID=2609248 RepID=UPI002017416E|nr:MULTISPECIES: ABC transporter permease [unclassified Actinomyces]MCL3778438.1 ABC transporter permease [Actinomyces sp. AC-20-1]MCL3790001.1 ABC transporter permease [Actinomyces sp. 187325]MCL3793072.1 ABC transporter permease [Actinomyces sp. 186855]MCL3794577.1 ABC transporter permease [Actinomyces sp. 217892]
MLTPSLLARLVLADLRRGPVVALVLALLTALVVALAGASVLLMARTQAATEQLWRAALPPDVVQMSAGPITDRDAEAIHAWAAQRDDVAQSQVSRTLLVPGAGLWIDGDSQAPSVLEPAFVTQNTSFDLLVDEDGQVLDPGPGEVALPVHYLVTGQAALGDTVEVRADGQVIVLTVVAFARDAQMNPSLVTSKRLLVHQTDYERLDALLDDEEQIIELRTTPGASAGQVLDAYTSSGLPAQGVAVDSSALRLMNGLSTYLVAAVALAIALLVLGVAALAVRLAVLAGVRADLPQLAALRALGLSRVSLAELVLAKHVSLALAGGLVGLVACAPLAGTLGASSLAYLGRPPTTPTMVLTVVLTAATVMALVVGGALTALRRELGRPVMVMLRAADGGHDGVDGAGCRRRWSLRSRTRTSPRHPLPRRRGTGLLRAAERLPVLSPVTWLGARSAASTQGALLAGVIAVATVLMVLPLGALTTLTDARFSTYLGVGQGAQLRVDVRQGAADVDALVESLRTDPQVRQVEVRGAQRLELASAATPGAWDTVPVEAATELVFTPHYVTGRAPQGPGEIALSASQAGALDVSVGQQVLMAQQAGAGMPVPAGGTPADRLTLVGTYSDVTNGGSTGFVLRALPPEPLWHVINMRLADGVEAATLADRIRQAHPGAKVTVPEEFAVQTVGSTTTQVRGLVLAATLAGLGIVLLVTVLSTVLHLERIRPDLTALAGVGMDRGALLRIQVVRAAVLACCGIVVGQVMAAAGGQALLGTALARMGAPGVSLMTRAGLTWGPVPAGIVAVVMAGTLIATRSLHPRTLTGRTS